MKATWKGQTIAESNDTLMVENNHYFPPDSVDRSFLMDSKTTTTCPWKGKAHYYTLVVNGEQNPDAAWYYPKPKPAAKEIKDYVAFWRGVEISE